jgi:restriction endonuclease S subunit/predicted ATPase
MRPARSYHNLHPESGLIVDSTITYTRLDVFKNHLGGKPGNARYTRLGHENLSYGRIWVLRPRMPEELPKGWVRTTLGRVCLPIENVQPEDTPDTSFTYFDIGGIDNEKNRIAETKTLIGANSPSRARQALQKNDILFSTVRTYLRKIAPVEHDYTNPVASTGFAVIRAAEGVSPQFLLFQVLSEDFLEPLNRLQSGTSYPAVRARDIFAQPILLPPTSEQERIVSKLSAAFSAIERAETAARRAQVRLQLYRTAVLEAALTGELTREWRNDKQRTKGAKTETGEALLKRLLVSRRARWEEAYSQWLHASGKIPKDDTWKLRYSLPEPPDVDGLGHLPKDWVWGSLDQCFQVERGRFSVRPRNDPAYYNGKYPFVQIGDLPPEGGVISEYSQTLNERGLGVSRQFPRGTILLAIVGATIANSGVLGFDACCPDSLVAIQSSETALLGFADLWLRANKLKLRNAAVASGGQPNINLQILRPFAIPLPPVVEQIEIVHLVESRLSAAAKLTATLELQLANGRAVRQALLREAFSGRLVSQNPDDESASMLLDHIHAARVQNDAGHHQTRRATRPTAPKKREPMKEQPLSPESLMVAWERIARKTDARRLFDEARFGADNVVQFYEALRATPEVRLAFQNAAQGREQSRKPAKQVSTREHEQTSGRFRLIELWLADFKNLKDYTVHFNPSQGLDVILGWNGTGKSNLFESLVIIFRDLHEWWEKNRWPDKPMNGFRLRYEMDDHIVEITWQPEQMKRPELKRGPIPQTGVSEIEFTSIKRDQLPLPRFVFGYYSGPTNRLAEHFLPMKQDHYDRLRLAKADDAKTLAKLLEQRRFFCAETHHAKYVLLGFSYKEDTQINEFLEKRLRIVGFESALFIIRKPLWAKSGSKAEDFWGATGIMRRVMERLRRYAIAPMVLQQKVNYGYRSATEDHYYFFLPDLASLHAFAAEYQDARTFFLALESTDFSELIHDVKIQVRVKSTDAEQVSITFHQLSEGEQQLLMVLGLMRFTKSHQSLVLLDEPDTHLNPHWSVDYLKDLARVMSDDALESKEQQTSQILMATHDPLVIASLLKEQIHLLKRDTVTGTCKWEPASVDPRGLGFTGILTSEMFGFRSDLDPETLADLDNKVRLVAKEGSLSAQEEKELESIDQRLVAAGFSKAFSDPYYAAFVRAWGRRHDQSMGEEQFVTPQKLQEIDRIASEVLKEAVAEVEKEVGN